MKIEHIEKRLRYLESILKKALLGPMLTYKEITQIKEMGIYIVHHDKDVLYVGQTSRAGGKRITEMGSHFLSHTFNNKLLLIELNNKGYTVAKLNRSWKEMYVQTGHISEVNFRQISSQINSRIRQDFTFQFFPAPTFDLNNLEHFFIAALAPNYNG
jgi:hypothetical protein